MIIEQLKQIDTGFTFFFEGDEVCVSSVIKHPSEEHCDVRLYKTENYYKLGAFKKAFIAQYLEQTGQENLLDINIISAGQHIVDELGLKRIKFGGYEGHYQMSGKHWTSGGVKPKTLLEIGKIATDSVAKKDFSTWLHNLKRFKNG